MSTLTRRAFALALLFAFTTATAQDARAPQPRPVRIAVLNLYHETNVFLDNETTLADFVYDGSPMKADAVFGSSDAMRGFVRAAREYGGIELVGIESPGSPRTGMGSGWVQKAAYDHLVARMVDEIRQKGPFEGVFMRLHGAMSVRGVPRPEAEAARRVREAVGPGTVIAAWFDPHGNEDAEFFRWADLAFAVKYYPHYDAHLQGERAARTLIRTIRKDYVPKVAVRKPPILTPDVNQWTGASPWMDLVQRALVWEAKRPDVFVNVFYGFAWADVPDVGMCIEVTTNGDQKLADEIAEDVAMFAWNNRERLMTATRIDPLDAAMTRLQKTLRDKQGPVVLGDYSDRSGNAVWILGETVKRKLSNVEGSRGALPFPDQEHPRWEPGA